MANLSVTANFAADTFTLTYTAGTGGTITGIPADGRLRRGRHAGHGSTEHWLPLRGLERRRTDSRTHRPGHHGKSVRHGQLRRRHLHPDLHGWGRWYHHRCSPQTVAYGEDGTPVTAVPNTGYHFVDWSDGVLPPTHAPTWTSWRISPSRPTLPLTPSP